MISHMRHHEPAVGDSSEPLVRGYAVTHPRGTVVLPQSADWDELVYASRGVMTVETATGTWVVPPDRAVWVPAGVDHRVVMTGRTSIRTLYLARGIATLPPQCLVVTVPPLLRELVIHAVRISPLDPAIPAHARLVGVILDLLETLPTAPLQLPMPTDPRAGSVARALLDRPADPSSVDRLARAAGAGRRTVERLFLEQTGLSVGRWRQRARLLAALRLLADGLPVTTVAHRVGYSTPSAFGAMFRAELGTSPARYFRSS